MIITHTQNAAGQRRVYLGAKGSLEAWVEPREDGRGWTFHMAAAPTTYAAAEAKQKAFAVHILLNLAASLNIQPEHLAAVPFEAIAALHTEDPTRKRRMPTGRHAPREIGYLAPNPGITVPAPDFAPRFNATGRDRRM